MVLENEMHVVLENETCMVLENETCVVLENEMCIVLEKETCVDCWWDHHHPHSLLPLHRWNPHWLQSIAMWAGLPSLLYQPHS